MDEKAPFRSSPLWIFLIALGGLVYVQQGGVPPTASPTPEPTASTSNRATDRVPETVEVELNEVLWEVHQLRQSDRKFPIASLVALVPDPEPGATQVGWQFDSYADGIQRAFQAADFLLVRRAFPATWTRQAEPRWRRRFMSPPAEEKKSPLQEPGLLVFRHRVQPGLFAVFLVGESPIRGVEPAEFQRAYELIEWLDPDWANTDRPVPIIGPVFSGSAVSLKRAIDSLKVQTQPRRGLRVVSGTATGSDVADALQSPGKLPIQYSATVIPDAQVLEAMYDYVRIRGGSLASIAVLAEATSGYGDDASRSAWKRQSPDTEIVESPRLVFHFPLHIAQARVAYERTRTGRDQPKPGSFESRIRQLELSLDEEITPRDIVPPLQPRMASFTVDLVLANILGSMAKEEVRYVLLLATDVRDKLFLARKLREHLPDVQLLTTESSLLFTHPDYERYLEGMIVGSTYPLFTKNQLWVVPSAVRRYYATGGEGAYALTSRVIQFADGGAAGVYNATLVLLGQEDLMREYAPPCFTPPCGDVDSAKRPPIWITAIGHGGVWPLSIVPASTDRTPVVASGGSVSPDPRANDLAARVSYSRFGAGALLIISILILAHAVIVLHAWAPRPGARDPSPWRMIEPLRPLATARREQRRWLLALLMVLEGILLALVALFSIFAWTARAGHGVVPGAVGPIIVGIVVLVLPCLLVPAALWRVGGTLGGGILAGLSLIATAGCVWAGSRPDPDTVFFYVRATAVGSGLSPVIPLFWIALALYAWTAHHLRRLHLCEALDVKNPLAADGVPNNAPLLAIETRVHDVQARGLWAIPRMVWAPVIAVGLAPCALLWSMLPSFEGRWYDRLFFWALVVAYLAVLSTCLRFAWLWTSIRTLLHELDHHPMTAAFDRLPKALRSSLRQRFYGYVPGAGDRARWARYWLAIGGRFQTSVGEKLATVAETSGGAALAHDACSLYEAEWSDRQRAGREVFGCESDVQRNLTERASEVARWLVPTDPQFERQRRSAPASIQRVLDRAEQFVAIEVVTSLGQKFVQLRTHVTFGIIGVLLITFAFSSYPFQPQRLLMVFGTTLAAGVIVLLLIAMFQADRDPLLSRMTGVQGGRVTLDRGLMLQVATYGVLPLIAILARQFPEAGRLFDSLLTALK
jgi:hypothetical protein